MTAAQRRRTDSPSPQQPHLCRIPFVQKNFPLRKRRSIFDKRDRKARRLRKRLGRKVFLAKSGWLLPCHHNRGLIKRAVKELTGRADETTDKAQSGRNEVIFLRSRRVERGHPSNMSHLRVGCRGAQDELRARPRSIGGYDGKPGYIRLKHVARLRRSVARSQGAEKLKSLETLGIDGHKLSHKKTLGMKAHSRKFQLI